MSKTQRNSNPVKVHRQTDHRDQQTHINGPLTLASWRKPEGLKLETIDQLIEHAADLGRFMFDREGQVPATWVCILKNGDIALVAPKEKIVDKISVTDAVRQLFKSLSVERYAFIAETWTGELRPHEKNVGSLASCPDRGESVWIYAEDGTEAQAAEMRILRTEHEKATLSDLHKFPCGAGDRFSVGGRFTGLLGERDGGGEAAP